MFEWATQPFYTLIVTFLFAPYFVNVVVGDKAHGQALWGYAAAVAGVLIAIGSPVLGAIADVKGRRKPWLAMFVVILCRRDVGALARRTRPAGAQHLVILAAFVIASTVAEFAVVFFNAMMPTLVPRDQLGKLSGTGWAMGYVGGLVALVIMAGFVAAEPSTGKTLLGLSPIVQLDSAAREGDRLVGPFSAVWLLLFALPLFLFTPDVPRPYRACDGRRRPRELLEDGEGTAAASGDPDLPRRPHAVQRRHVGDLRVRRHLWRGGVRLGPHASRASSASWWCWPARSGPSSAAFSTTGSAPSASSCWRCW